MPYEEYLYNEELSLKERWKLFQAHQKTHGTQSRNISKLCCFLLAFQVPSQLFVFLSYVIPTVFEDFDEWTRYYLKVLACYCCLQGLANYWFCFLYDTSVHDTKDRPKFDGLDGRWKNPPETFIPYEAEQVNGFLQHGQNMHYCSLCELYVPPRARHCRSCRKCILKRDHHCFLLGICIGHKNQRYFVVLTFYAFINGVFGGYFTHKYLRYSYWPISESWIDFVFPVTLYKLFTGHLPLRVALMVYHVYMEYLFGIIAFLYFIVQMTSIYQGKTLQEIVKKLPVKVTSSPNAQFVSVFGNLWMLNFVFPTQIIFRQRDNGTRWEGMEICSSGDIIVTKSS